jgi:predicted enzyme related to lactoylglutathione lyase
VEPEAERAASFYAELFGWEAENLMPADSPGKYFMCKLRGRAVAAVVSYHPAPEPPPAQWGTYVGVQSADESAATAADLGAGIVVEPFDSPAGGRMAVLSDPSGAVFSVWEPGRHKGAQVVNEPGAWAMSLLSAPDPDDARRFYGAVFGWQAETFPAGDAELMLWRLPGFVGGEPQQPVPRDVVAVMAPIGREGPPPQWSVDFWVHDADGTAEMAAGLGGAVVLSPYDTPGFRRAVLADPHGATFSVSQLML